MERARLASLDHMKSKSLEGGLRSSGYGGSAGSSSTEHHHQLSNGSESSSSSTSSASSSEAGDLTGENAFFQESFANVSRHIFADPDGSDSDRDSDVGSVAHSDRGRGSSVISAFSAASVTSVRTFESARSIAQSASAQSADFSVASSLEELRRMPPEMPPTDDTVLPTPGSLGHPELCQRACIYFGSGPCQNGAFCGYCHLPHNPPPVKLNKRQRLSLQRLRAPELLALVLEKLRSRAQDQGFLMEADDMLQHVEELLHRSQQTAGNAAPSLSDESYGNLSRVLGRMSMAGLLGFVIRRQDVDREVVDKLVEEVAILKARLFHQLS